MRKYIGLVAIIFVTSIVLAACGDNENSEADNNKNNSQEEDVDASSQNNENQANNNDNGTPRSERIGEDEWDDDESGLSIGETGVNDSNLGKAELTLDSVEMVDEDELEEDAEVTQLIAAYITVKNIGEDSFSPEDVLYDGELYEKGEKFGTVWDYYDGISDEWDDELKPGKETSGMIVFDNWDSNAYELVLGDKLEDLGNKVSFEFEKDEMD